MIKLRNTQMTKEGERRVLRGVLDPSTLEDLIADWYQRGNITNAKLKKMIKAASAGTEFQDITIGMRGDRVSIERGAATLLDKCYIIDGYQRWTAVGLALDYDPNCFAHLGAKVIFPTDIAYELALFREMNTGHTSMAASVILRNEKEHS